MPSYRVIVKNGGDIFDIVKTAKNKTPAFPREWNFNTIHGTIRFGLNYKSKQSYDRASLITVLKWGRRWAIMEMGAGSEVFMRRRHAGGELGGKLVKLGCLPRR